MRVVIQRVSEASVSIGGQTKAAIGGGLVVFVAIEDADGAEDIEWLTGKIVRLRVFNDENGVMNRSISEVAGEVLVVSQFTLFASTKKGNRPSYTRSARSEMAIPLYQQFVACLTSKLGTPIKTGDFGVDMLVRIANDGPVTLLIDSKARE